MRIALLVLLTAALPTWGAPAPLPRETATSVMKKLEGIWRLKVITRNGEELARKSLAEMRWLFAGDRIIVKHLKSNGNPVTFSVDPRKKPGTFDMIYSRKDGTKRIVKGIYKLDGDTLKLCYPMTGEDRPGDFLSPPGMHRILLDLVREKQ